MWALDMIDTGTAFLLTFQDTESIPDDLRTKLQVFDFMRNFLRYAWSTAQSPSSVVAHSFAGYWQVCPKVDDAYDRGRPPALREIAALEAILVSERRTPEKLDQELLKAVDNLNTVLMRQVGIDMADYWSLPMGSTLAVQIELSSRDMPLPNIQDAMVDFLSNLIEGLDAPVLVQLERGQLQGLSRAETKQLKERVGFR
ncbi:hypothetical protein N8T08_002789 [Aspergillus melleus]|uniref:Uncharacterized protein n=1 Tax=Aspergillus melleus TaxID=138277 RepID=A0ACC3B8N8_9EURO|nr:hypothetical protein N8T08_002789 [Aspergillus melleus]